MLNKFTFSSRLIVVLLVVVCCVVADQSSKLLVRGALRPGDVEPVLGGIVELRFIENPGMMHSLGARLPETIQFWLFTVGIGGVTVGVFFWLLCRRSTSAQVRIACSLIVAGSISNLIDRFQHGGRVLDYLLIDLAGRRTDIFNLADATITAGVVLLLGCLLFRVRGISHHRR